MKIFFDTEFTGLTEHAALISVGMVTDPYEGISLPEVLEQARLKLASLGAHELP